MFACRDFYTLLMLLCVWSVHEIVCMYISVCCLNVCLDLCTLLCCTPMFLYLVLYVHSCAPLCLVGAYLYVCTSYSYCIYLYVYTWSHVGSWLFLCTYYVHRRIKCCLCICACVVRCWLFPCTCVYATGVRVVYKWLFVLLVGQPPLWSVHCPPLCSESWLWMFIPSYMTVLCTLTISFIHSFIRGGGWPLAVFRRAFQPTASAEA